MPVERSWRGVLAVGIGLGIVSGALGTWAATRGRGVVPVLPLMQIEPPNIGVEPAVLPEAAEPLPDDSLDDLPPPTSARAGNSAAASAAVRRAIETLLPNASAEEREIWYQQFQDTPPGIVEDLLRMRRDIGGSQPDGWSPPPGLSPQPLEIDPLGPDGPIPGNREAVAASGAIPKTLEQLRRLTQQNLLHQDTPGFRRLVPLVAPRGKADAADMVDLSFVGVRIDVTPGTIEESARPWDLAIEDQAGTAFFAVETPHGLAYTRCGSLEADDDGRLSIRFPGGRFPLAPEVMVPLTARNLEFLPTGEIRGVVRDAAAAAVLGRITLTEFRDPTQLVYGEDGWFTAPQSAAGTPLAPSDGWSLRSGALERSNVNSEVEFSRLKQIHALQQAFMEMGGPVPTYDRSAMAN
ncbi:MAG: hypothetical protein SFV23_05560 [Planctomycetaceae bacterium]|nr:hypothetical protein [Planctomycetaceae bacterium]